MADETQEQRLAVEARWVGLGTAPVALANQAVWQVNAGEIIVTFGQVVPPPLIGDPEVKMRQMERRAAVASEARSTSVAHVVSRTASSLA